MADRAAPARLSTGQLRTRELSRAAQGGVDRSDCCCLAVCTMPPPPRCTSVGGGGETTPNALAAGQGRCQYPHSAARQRTSGNSAHEDAPSRVWPGRRRPRRPGAADAKPSAPSAPTALLVDDRRRRRVARSAASVQSRQARRLLCSTPPAFIEKLMAAEALKGERVCVSGRRPLRSSAAARRPSTCASKASKSTYHGITRHGGGHLAWRAARPAHRRTA